MLRLSLAFTACLTVLPAFAQTPTLRDHAYGPDPDQRYDLYTPANRDAPTVLMVHGGGWLRGDKEMTRVVDAKLARWLPRGIAFATTNYRMQPKAPPIEQARDVARALADLQRNSAKTGVGRSNMVLMGHSAGAHLIALLAARPELLAEAGAEPPLGYVLLDSGALDVPAIMNARHFRLYDRAFGGNPVDWLAASPYQQFVKPSAPILTVCSMQRRDACPQAHAFVAKARQMGTVAEVLSIAKSHGEINADLGSDTSYTQKIEHFLSHLSPSFAEHLRQ